MTAKPKLTKNQSVVLKALTRAKKPLTAYEILDLATVRTQGLKAPLTIYRALDRLRDEGLVHRIESLNAFLACCEKAGHTEPVGFVICDNCRKSVELRLSDCETHLGASAEAAGFQVGEIRVEMTGLCPACVKAAARQG